MIAQRWVDKEVIGTEIRWVEGNSTYLVMSLMLTLLGGRVEKGGENDRWPPCI